jgi:glycosyltransferase involved in cell wall biosynthesis
VKIAIVDPAAFTLPYDTALCSALADDGHDVTLFTTRFAHGRMPTATTYAIVEWFYRRRLSLLPRRIARGLQHPFNLWRLCREIRRQQFDVVHVQWSVIDAIDVRLWNRLKTPVVFTAHNSVGRAEGLSCEQLRSFDAVVAHSEYGAEGLRTECAIERVWHVPHGAFDALENVSEPATPPVALDDGPVVALTGLLRPYKGVDVLLRAWPKVLERVPNAQLVIAGRPMGMELPTELPPRAHVLARFLEEDEFAWVLRRTDVVCLPYSAIDLSGVLFSALALGRPLVLSDVGGFSELIGQGAVLFPPGDADALAETLAAALGDADLLARLAKEAAIAAHERYSWAAIAARYGTLYPQLLANDSSTISL